jgi:cysteinyl-tRNA synthetase
MNSIRTITSLILILVGLAACKKEEKTNPKDLNYRQEMRNFVEGISAYAKAIRPDFAIIPQNGSELVSTNGENTVNPDMDYIQAIDGIGQEDLYYGYNADDQETPSKDKIWIKSFLDLAKDNGQVKIMVTDYCSTHSKMDHSYIENNTNDYISFAASHRGLDNIPNYPNPIYNENSRDVNSIQNAKNFLYLLSPDNEYASKQAFVDAVKSTNYDFIIMDFFYDGEEFTTSQLDELRKKANGGKRLLICYMSIGEAEDYRYYWQNDWKPGNPSYIEKENPNWPGNFYVRYWDSDWQKIIFGNDSSYLKRIIDSGFDGVYLDIIDAYEQFE